MVLLAVATMAPSVGAQEPEEDRAYVVPILTEVLEGEKSNVEVPWYNSETRHGGVIMVERTFYKDPQTPCRDYRRTFEQLGKEPIEIRGTGCRAEAGLWDLEEVKPPPAPGAGPSVAAAPPPAAGPPPESSPIARSEPPPKTIPPSCSPITAVRVPCHKPPAFTDYTMPAKAQL